MGELRALQDEDVDLESGTLRVERSWDKYEGFIAPKSKAGKRTIPVCEHLRMHLEQRKRRPAFFLGSPERPFDTPRSTRGLRRRGKRQGSSPIGLHECRHSFSTFLDAAGVSETRADRYMGHSDASVASRYRHPVQYAEDAARLDDYLSGAEAGKIVRLNERAA